MNWYKKALYEDFDWEAIYKELAKKINRRPTPKEMQEEMMRRIQDTSFQKERPQPALSY